MPVPGNNFGFDNTVPAATHNPSSDQPIMLSNNASTQGWAAQDHYGYNTTGPTNNFGGLHQQVSFPANNTPSGFTLPTLFTGNDTANHPQLFYYATSAAASQNQYLAGANQGSVLLMGGIILKWGANTANDNTTISFTTAFPNNCYQVFTTVFRNVTSTTSVIAYVGSISPSSWLLRTNLGAGPLLDVRWLAIGN